MRKFVVAGTPLVPFGNQDDSRSAEELEAETRARLLLISVTETPVDGWAQELYQDLQELYDIDPAYFQNSGATVSMGNYDLGVNPHTGNSFSPFDIWFYGPSNQEWVGFSNRLDQILTSESWSRQVLGDVIATAMFAIFQRFNQVGLQLGPVGGSLGWTQSGPWTINFCYSGYCLKVRIKADRTFEFLEATDEAGNLVPQLFGNGGWAGSYALPASDPAFQRLVDYLDRRGIPVSGNSCAGWLMLICTYVNGVLTTCYTEINCD